MQTQLIERHVVGVPWLQRDRDGTEPEQHPIHSFPFSIGRVESADLQIDDARVSREHAVILREGKTYRVRDLHSTNGTLLNGQRVQDAELTDGDILVIADVEFTFYTERSGSSYSTATEVMGPGTGTTDEQQARDVVRTVRRLQQSLTHRAIDVHFRPVVDLTTHRIFGHEALRSAGDDPDFHCEQLVLASANRIAGRLYQLARLVAVEEAARFGLGDNLFLPVEAAEVGSDALVDSLARLARLAPNRQRLIIAIQENVVCDIPYFQTLCLGLRDLGIRTAYYGFAGNRAQIAEKSAIAPNFLLLAPSLTVGIHRHADRQRQVQAIARACQETGCQPIATGLQTDDDARVCREMGCRYGQGGVFGPVARADVLAHKAADSHFEMPSHR